MRNKLKQYIPYALITIPFVFWYSAIIVEQDTFSSKLTAIGFVSALHITFSAMFYGMKKDGLF